MLYISKRTVGGKVVVVDTDDNSKTVAGREELDKAINLGLEIYGVEYTGTPPNAIIASTDVWQNDSSISINQLKTRMFKGITIKTDGNIITSIDWDDNIVQPAVSVRLSDFGTECAECIFDTRNARHTNPITIILDDKCKVRRHTFDGAVWSNTYVDIREVTSERQASYIYMCYVSMIVNLYTFECVIDNPDRFERWEAYGVVVKGVNPESKVFDGEVRDFLDKMFYNDFKKLANMPFKYLYTKESLQALKKHLKNVVVNKDFWRSNPTDFWEIYRLDKAFICIMIQNCSVCNINTLGAFYTYIIYAKASDEMKELYVKFANRAYNWLLNEGESFGIQQKLGV